MAIPSPKANTTLVILLGASKFEKAPKIQSSASFKRSAEAVKEYFLDKKGFGLVPENLMYCFDSKKECTTIDEMIGKFLKQRIKNLGDGRQKARDLLFYYIGHGGFSRDSKDYFLALRTTRQDNQLLTSYSVRALGKTLKEYARFLRRFLILDACFSASAYTAFQSSPLDLARVKTLEELPERGTALLSAAGPEEPARTLKGKKYTMFTGAFLDILRVGSEHERAKFSLAVAGQLAWSRIKELYPDEAVRPEVHSPDQREGDVADLPIFPNKCVPSRRRKLTKTAKPVSFKGKRLKGIVDILYECHKLLKEAEKAGGSIWFEGLTFAFGPAHQIQKLSRQWTHKYPGVTSADLSDEFNSYFASLLVGTQKYTSNVILVALKKELTEEKFLKPLYENKIYAEYLERYPEHLNRVKREIKDFHDKIEAFATICKFPIFYVEEMENQAIVTVIVDKDGKKKTKGVFLDVGTKNVGKSEAKGLLIEDSDECEKLKKHIINLYKKGSQVRSSS
jgi:hypothetical protein